MDIKKYFFRAIGLGVVSVPFVLYSLYLSRFDNFTETWLAQNKILSPNPIHYLIAFGLLIPFVVYGVKNIISSQNKKSFFLVVWIISLIFLVYIPHNLQRRLAEGAWVAVVAVALIGIEKLQSTNKPRGTWVNLAVNGFYAAIPFLFLTTLFILTTGFFGALNPGMPAFRAADEIAVFKLMAQIASPGDIVLSSPRVGNALPAWAPLRVVIGHGPESINYTEIEDQIELFFQTSTSDIMRLEFIEWADVDYLFYGPEEKALGDWNPEESPFLYPIYDKGQYQLYEMKR